MVQEPAGATSPSTPSWIISSSRIVHMFVTRKHRNKHISCNPPLSIHYLKSYTKSLSALGGGLEWRNDSVTELTLLSKIQTLANSKFDTALL